MVDVYIHDFHPKCFPPFLSTDAKGTGIQLGIGGSKVTWSDHIGSKDPGIQLVGGWNGFLLEGEPWNHSQVIWLDP